MATNLTTALLPSVALPSDEWVIEQLLQESHVVSENFEQEYEVAAANADLL